MDFPTRGVRSMVERIAEYPEHLQASSGVRYAMHVDGEERPDGTWVGWIVFTATSGSDVRRTERESTQPTREALTYSASGLEPLYFEGAFARASTAGPRRSA